LFDMINNSKFDAEEMQREKQVIIEEINMYEDNPLMHIEDIYDETVYKGNKLSENIAGTRESIRSMMRDDLMNFKSKNYDASNIVIGLAGDVNEEDISLIKKYFNEYSFANAQKDNFTKFISEQKQNNILISNRDTEQVQLALGFPGLEYENKMLPALKVLTIILGGNMSSRLFISIRERKGLAYFIRSSIDTYLDTGSLKIQAGIDKERIYDAIKAIVEELRLIIEKGITEEELKRAKDYIEGKLYLSLEDMSDLAMWYTKQEVLLNKIKTPKERIDQIFKVTKDDVDTLAKTLITNNKFNIALIGPYKDESEFLELLKL